MRECRVLLPVLTTPRIRTALKKQDHDNPLHCMYRAADSSLLSIRVSASIGTQVVLRNAPASRSFVQDAETDWEIPWMLFQTSFASCIWVGRFI